MAIRGKHRKTSNNRNVARVAVAGMAVGAPLALATVPAYASGVNWNAVAQCESSGNWHINTGNGYYGGLQFKLSTWRAFGGEGMPHKASRAQQIAIAENVLDGQGINAWPVCGDNGVTGALYNPDSVYNPASDSSTSTVAQQNTQPQPTQQQSTQPQQQSTQPQQQNTQPQQQSTQPQQQSTQQNSQPAPDPAPQPDPILSGVAKDNPEGEYTVKPGDTLSEIAQEHDIKGGWPAIYELNDKYMSNPNYIIPGQQLELH